MPMERLDKLLSGTGHWSRREVKDLVRQGRVRVDGEKARKPEEKCDPACAQITVDGQAVDCAPFVYLMLHKPAGLLSATEEAHRLCDRPLITMSMGPLGAVSRVAGETFGSAVTFGAAGKASAPGQIAADDLYRILSVLHTGE